MKIPLADVWGAFRRQPAVRASNVEIGKQRKATEQEVHERLAKRGADEAGRADYLAEVKDGYDEQDRRGERAERRATTVLASVSVITTLLGIAGTALTGPQLRHQTPARIVVSFAVALVIGLFGLAALWALQVLFPRDQFRRPSTPPMLLNRASRSGDELYVDIVAALLDSARWNQRIEDARVARLHKASGFFGGGVVLLLLLATLLPVYAAFFPPPDDKPQKGETGASGPPGAQGPPGRTVVHASQVRAVFTSSQMRARAGRPFRVRYAVTRVGEATISVMRDGRPVRRIVQSTAVGANGTDLLLKREGTYVLQLDVRARNGSTDADLATVVAR